MATMAQSPTSFGGNLALKPIASDLLRSLSSCICDLPLKALGRSRLGAKRRDSSIVAKVLKWEKHEYPWPKEPDLNVKGGVVRHLSSFKPLKQKPRPVTLDFEKPIMDLLQKIVEVGEMANETGLDFSDQIFSLENKYQQALKDVYNNLTPYQRLKVARHPNRPTCLDHVFNITDTFVELHGDRAGYDDPSMVTGLGAINGRTYMFIGTQKGRNTKENIQRNFGMPTPHGYRKALRMMRYADHHGFPIVTLIDTPGAHADLKAEHLGQGEAIAFNLREMFGLKVPIVSIVIGEGGSGGALAIGCANKLLMLENAVFYVASPEACAAILWKDAKAAPEAAGKLKITARDLMKLQICDGVIPEPLGGAHADPYETSQNIKSAIVESMEELDKMDTDTLLKHRFQKYRKIGVFQEGIPIDPERKVNMKKKEEPIVPITMTSESELRDEVEKLKQQVMEASKSSSKMVLPETELKAMVEKLKREIDYEYDEAAKALGMGEKIGMLREEVAKGRNLNDELAQSAMNEKIEQTKSEFAKNLPSAPNFPSLISKIELLKELSKGFNLSKKDELQLEVNKRFSEYTNRPDIKHRIETLKAEIASSGTSNLDSNPVLKEKFIQLTGELDSEFKSILKSLGLEPVKHLNREAFEKINSFNDEVDMIIDEVVSSSDLKERIDLLKAEVEKLRNSPDEESKIKIQGLIAEMKQAINEAVSTPELKAKHERLVAKISGSSNGSLDKEETKEDSQVKVNNQDSSRSFV